MARSFFSRFGWQFRTRKANRGRSGRRSHSRSLGIANLGMERLEDRITPATLTINNTLGTLVYQAALAQTYLFEGRYSEAKPLFEKVLDVRRRTGGEEHPDALRAQGNLAMFEVLQGMKDPPLTRHPETGKKVKRLLGLHGSVLHARTVPPIGPSLVGNTTFMLRGHDSARVVALAKGWGGTNSVRLVGFGEAGPWALLARAVAGDAIDRAAIDLNGSDFDRVKDDDGARQEFVDLLELLGPADPRTAEYRKALTSRLF